MFISISLLLIGACDTCFMEAVHNYLFDWVILAGYHTSSYKSLVMVFILGALPCVNKLLAPAINKGWFITIIELQFLGLQVFLCLS